MQIIAVEDERGDLAIVERDRGGIKRRERVSMILIGPQPLGTWVVVSLGLAREVVDDDYRHLIEDALEALTASLTGTYDPEKHFSDLSTFPRPMELGPVDNRRCWKPDQSRGPQPADDSRSVPSGPWFTASDR